MEDDKISLEDFEKIDLEMDKNGLSEEELKELIQQFFKLDYTIDEVLEINNREQEEIRNVFDNSFEMYHAAYKTRKMILKELYISKIILIITKKIGLLLNSQNLEFTDEAIERAKNTRSIIKKDKVLFNEIKIALEKLNSANVIDCVPNLTVLLSMLFKRTQLLYQSFNDYIEESKLEMKNIGYISNKSYNNEIRSLDDKINDFSLKLGLKR